MYKDDNLISRMGGEALLRMVTESRGTPPASSDQGRPSCDGSYTEALGLAGYPLASVYAPVQSFEELYDLETALKQGTIFKELDLGFYGRRLGKEGKAL